MENKEIYNCLRQFIKVAGLTNKAFAKRLDMNPSTFQTMMNRKPPIKIELFAEILLQMAIIIEHENPNENPEKVEKLEQLFKEFGDYSTSYNSSGSFRAPDSQSSKGSFFFFFFEEEKERQKLLLNAYNSLNNKGKDIAVQRVEELSKIPDYQKQNPTDE